MRYSFATLLALLAFAAPASAATPGVNVGGLPSDANTADVIASGAKYARFFLLWSDAEPAKGQYSEDLLSLYDRQLDRLNANGVKTVFTVVGAPQWASGSTERYTPPKDPLDYAHFAKYIATRFKGKVAAYEVWNEPDESMFYKPGPDPAAYTALLKAAYPAFKAGDPDASVITGPLTGNNYDFLAQLYANGAQGSFDAVGVHTDTACLDRGPDAYYRDNGRLGRFTFLAYREVHQTMLDNGDDKPIWMTELGWSSTQKTCSRGEWAGKKPAGVGEANQAEYLREAFHCMAQDDYLKVGLWFNLQDVGSADEELNRYGLQRSNGTHKPAWDALKDVAAGNDKVTKQCGDFGAPSISVKAPTEGAQYGDSLFIQASASDSNGLGRITFLADGKKIRNFTKSLSNGKTVSIDWQGAKSLGLGEHTVTVQALDMFGNVSESTVHVRHVDATALPAQATTVDIKVRGKGLKRTVSGRVRAPAAFGLRGKVQVLFQFRGKNGWRTLHKASKNANKPFKVSQRLARKGRWRVQVRYVGLKPFLPSTSRRVSFKAK